MDALSLKTTRQKPPVRALENDVTDKLNLIVIQRSDVVSVRTDNLRWLLAEVISKHEPANTELRRGGDHSKPL